MSESDKHKPHSADYFNEERNYWWNQDFLKLMGKRWGLERVSTVLDVGCGIGHWGQMLADILPPNAKVTGIDKEAQWVEQASERAKALNLRERFAWRLGSGLFRRSQST